MAGACNVSVAKSLELTELSCGLAHLEFAFVPFDNSRYTAGAIAAVFAFLPYVCGVFLIGYALASRSRTLAVVVAGFFINEAVNKVLKNVFRQSRPPGAALSNYGMPSSHSQFIAYLAFSHFLLSKRSTAQRLVHPLFVLLAGLAAVMMWSRVFLGFHSLSQTVVGAGAGAAVASAWIVAVRRYPAIKLCLEWCFEVGLSITDHLAR
jgi:dolichyldiphosphatase